MRLPASSSAICAAAATTRNPEPLSLIGRSGLRLLVIVTSLALGSCVSQGASPPKDVESTRGQHFDWKRIDSDGTFRSIEAINSADPPPHLTAAGVKDGKPLIGYIVEGTLTEIPFRNKGARGGGLRAMTNDGSNFWVTDVTDPRSGEPARLWHGYSDPPDPDLVSPTTEDKALRTATGLQPVWLTPLSTSEDFGVIGVVREKDRWRVHGWLMDFKMAQLDAGSRLNVRGTPSNERLLTGITQGSMLAAGDVTDGEPDSSRAPQVWTLDLNYGPERKSRWKNRPLDPVPDGLTDIATWEIGWQVAGHKDLAPVAYDFDDGDGEPIDMPSTRLDPDHPGVFIVLNVDAPPVLATQSVGGNKVWFKADGRWHDIAAPEGRLQAIEFAGEEFYVLVDGSIWHTQAPAELLAKQPRD